MTTDTEQTGNKRFAWLAVVLSIVMPGVGHVYCGKFTRGLVFGLLYGLAIPVVLGLLAYGSPASTVVFGFLMIAAAFGVVIAAAVDTYRIVRRTRPDYQPKAYNHTTIYVLIGLMIQGSSVGYALHVRSSLFEAFRVPAASEYPNIVPGDRILADKTAYRKTDPQVGDIVLFRPPNENWRIHYIKRIVALGGETVEMKDGVLYVNDKPLPRRQISAGSTQIGGQNGPGPDRTIQGDVFAETNGSVTYKVFLTADRPGAVTDFDKITVPQHHCFVLGDNRNYSLDSRHFGPLPYANIAGRIDYIYWPVDTWARFGRLH
jgi:signal peptidase I